MAKQDLDRAAPPLRQRLGGSGDTPGTAYNRILIDFVDITLRMQQFGRDSIGPNHEMYEYSRGILERSTGRLVDIAFSSTQAFGFSVDGVVPSDDVAGFHAMDVLQHFELVPDSPPATSDELTLLKEKYPDEPSLADVKARANEMLDALYMPGGSGSDAAKASFEAQAQAMGT